MIPKVIHYCWFGHGDKSNLIKRCIKSWKKYCPDYEIMEWTEDNFDVSSSPLYVQQAYEAGKWAFVSDYARFWIVYNYGGLYLDTDVELIASVDDMIENDCFFGFESSLRVSSGLGFGAVKGFSLLKSLMEDYNNVLFLNEDGSYNTKPCTYINLHCFTDFGFELNNELQTINGCTLYPSDYFSPKNYDMLKAEITPNTRSIHHFCLSWQTDEQRKKHQKENRKDYYSHLPNKLMIKFLGETNYQKFKNLFK